MGKPTKQQKPIQKCKTCMGYGLWPFGDPSPIGPMDAADLAGYCKKCPECGKGDVE